jgi:DnaJ family protein C protein 1
MSTGLQYVIQRINYSRDLARVERIVNEARMAAWGPKMTPTNHPRKVKVNLSGTDEGKWIEMIVDGETVYIVSGCVSHLT